MVGLDQADGREFVEAYLDTEPNRLGARFRDALYAQTGGHALFTVESVRNLQERGELFRDEAGRWVRRESLDWGDLPARVEATIAERIERLPEYSRRLLSAASAQGDDFTAELVAELTGEPVAEVIAALSGTLARQHALVRAEGMVRPEGAHPVNKGLRRGPAPCTGSGITCSRSTSTTNWIRSSAAAGTRRWPQAWSDRSGRIRRSASASQLSSPGTTNRPACPWRRPARFLTPAGRLSECRPFAGR